VSVKVEEIARELASGYPNHDALRVTGEFVEILDAVLPALAEKTAGAREQGADSVEAVWKAIRDEAETVFQATLDRVERLKVVYVVSKFMNNRKIGTMITEAALVQAAGEEV
jgi:hypothetical protein